MPTRSQDQTQNLHILGTGRLPAFEDGPGVGLLESFPNCYPQRPYVISISFPEFTSLCPVTGQPDWASLQIHYAGPQIDQEGLLKYIISLRSSEDFHEQCVERIFLDILKMCKPQSLTVYARYTRRGGIDINPWRSNFSSGKRPQTLRHARQ